MAEITENMESWEDIFENLTEDVSSYRWAMSCWDDPPKGYDQATLLWEALDSRARSLAGLAAAQEAPADYRDSLQRLNRLWDIGEDLLQRMIRNEAQVIDSLVQKGFSKYQDEIQHAFETVRRLAQDGFLLDDPDWVEDDLMDAGHDFIIGFQQMANVHGQLASGPLDDSADSTAFTEKYRQIDAVFKNSFRYFTPLANSLKALQKREYGSPYWWFERPPGDEGLHEPGLAETFFTDLIPRLGNGPEAEGTDCPQADNAISYAFGELSGADRSDFREHLINCSHCSQLVHDVRFAQMQAEADPAEPELPEALAGMDKNTSREVPSSLNHITGGLIEKLRDFLTLPKAVSALAAAGLTGFILYSSLVSVSPPGFGVDLSLVRKITDQTATRGEGAYRESPVPPDGVLKSGDSLRIQIKMDRDAFFCLVLKDSRGIYSLLHQGQAEAGSGITFPDRGEWLRLDSNTGVETLFLIAGKNKIKGLDKKLEQLKTTPPEKVFPESEVKAFAFKHE